MSPLVPRFFTTSLLPVRERLVLKAGCLRKIGLRVRVGHFYHQTFGHSLIDTGYFNDEMLRTLSPSPYLSLYRAFFTPSAVGHDALATRLAALGITRQQIRTVLLTHFHADHIGRLRDFPDANILCSRKAWNSYRQKSRLQNALSGVFDVLLPDEIEKRLAFFEDYPVTEAPGGLGSGYDLLHDGSLLAIDLPGHADGHVGFCFPLLPTSLLYAADLQWLIEAVVEQRMPGFPASLVAADREGLRSSVEKVRAFIRWGGDVMLCHDPNNHRYDLNAASEALS